MKCPIIAPRSSEIHVELYTRLWPYNGDDEMMVMVTMR
jgi:hypothetical protein